jgi:hypothetical protein
MASSVRAKFSHPARNLASSALAAPLDPSAIAGGGALLSRRAIVLLPEVPEYSKAIRSERSLKEKFYVID